MVRFGRAGSIYFHLLVISLAILSFIALKDLNFSNLAVAPDISTTQGWALIFTFLFAVLVIFVMFIHGLLRKEKKLGGLGIFSLFMLYTAVLFVVGVGLYPHLFEQTGTQYSYRMMLIPAGSVFIVLAAAIFLLIKFPDDRERRWFVMAVRQELKHPSKVVCPNCETVISAKARRCYSCKKKMR